MISLGDKKNQERDPPLNPQNAEIGVPLPKSQKPEEKKKPISLTNTRMNAICYIASFRETLCAFRNAKSL